MTPNFYVSLRRCVLVGTRPTPRMQGVDSAASMGVQILHLCKITRVAVRAAAAHRYSWA